METPTSQVRNDSRIFPQPAQNIDERLGFWLPDRSDISELKLYCDRQNRTKAGGVQISTKSTIVIGKTFHFYREVLDEDRIYLELEGVQFEAGYNRVMVPIPVHIWEVIRRFPGVDFSLADMNDDEVLEMVQIEVDKRVSAFEKGETGLAYSGGLIYGVPDIQREEQVKRGMDYFQEKRKRLLEIRAAIESHK